MRPGLPYVSRSLRLVVVTTLMALCGSSTSSAGDDERSPSHELREGIPARPAPFLHATLPAATISFGQAMPEKQMQQAQDATLGCDLFLVAGSSLVVYPAAGFPLLAKRMGARLVILNRTPTDQDEYADLVMRSGIGATLTAVLTLI